MRRFTFLSRPALLASIIIVGAIWGVASAGAATVYDAIPSTVPGNVPSQAFEAQSTSEFGDRVHLAGADRTAQSVTVLMSSWGCENGSWSTGDCATTPGATFSEPVTLNLYAVGSGGSVGALIATKTQTFAIPYRPSASPSCGDGRWSTGSSCFNGLATPITFDLSSAALTLPDTVIVGVAYNTTHYGASPYGELASCYTEPGGCGYDALNVGLVDPSTASVGSDDAPDDAYLNSSWSGAYCPSDQTTGTFRLDAGCWTGFTPAVRIDAATVLGGNCAVSTDPVHSRITLLADCMTDHTLLVPNGFTFDGAGHEITAVDPPAGHFLGAVLTNAGTSASMTNVEITASGLVDICDGGVDRLRGILLDDASGSITNTIVHGVRQGHSGCQEGNAIEARNFTSSTQRAVTITGNRVYDYMKNGITANGAVAATIDGNTVAGDGPVGYIAQNGIQVGFGATGDVNANGVTGNWYTGADVACGILAFQASGLHQSKNALSSNERDFCNFGRGGGQFSPQG